MVNFFRPLTRTAAAAAEVLREIQQAAALPFTAIVNNSNLGEETRAEHVLGSAAEAERLSVLTGLPLRFTALRRELLPVLAGRMEKLFPLELQEKIC